MPIDSTLLTRLKENDPTLIELDLANKKLKNGDIYLLAEALMANTSLTRLQVSNNQIGDEGAKALASNTILTTLAVSDNQIRVEGIKALASNTTLTMLCVYGNQIGVEGAKAFAFN